MHNMAEKKPDNTGITFGMWLFLYTELMLFGGLFVLYSVYFDKYTADFIEGGKELALVFGAVNTLILLVSSFAVAASITAVRKRSKNLATGLLAATWISGVVFLINQYFEWGAKIHHGIYPNAPDLVDGPPGRNIFFGMYYVITGLHGIHIIIGLILISICIFMVHTRRIHENSYIVLENSGLYWHLIDIIWIFIFPLFYLVI